jgi:Ca2+/Na+ antiporter
MYLIMSALCFSLALLLCYVALLASKSPTESMLTGDMAVGSIYVPLLIGCGAMGAVFLVRFIRTLGQSPVTLADLTVAACLLGGSILLAGLLHRQLRLLSAFQASTRVLKPGTSLPGDSSSPSATSPRDAGKVA